MNIQLQSGEKAAKRSVFMIICLSTSLFCFPSFGFNDNLHAEDSSEKEVVVLLRRIRNGTVNERIVGLKRLRRLAIERRLADWKNESIELCLKLIRDDNSEVAYESAYVLECCGFESVPMLVDAIETKEPQLQAVAAEILGGIAMRNKTEVEKLDSAIPALSTLISGERSRARNNAVRAISRLGPKAIPQMVNALDNDDLSQELRKGFVRHGALSVQPLCGCIREGSDLARRRAAELLFHVSWQAPEALPAFQIHALSTLLDELDSDDDVVQLFSIRTLGRMGAHAKPALTPLIQLLEKRDVPHLRIAEAVGRIGPDIQHLDALFECAAELHTSLAKQLERVNASNGFENSLRNKLRNEINQIGPRFGATVSNMGDRAVPNVIDYLDDSRRGARETALWALYSLGGKAAPAVPALVRHLSDGDGFAADILAQIGPQAEPAIPHLVKQLETEKWSHNIIGEVQYNSRFARALSAIGPPAIPALRNGLTNKHEMVKAGCLQSLWKMDAKIEIPVAEIETLTHDPSPAVVAQAMLVLVKLGVNDEVTSILQRLSKDRRREVSRAAVGHLNELRAE